MQKRGPLDKVATYVKGVVNFRLAPEKPGGFKQQLILGINVHKNVTFLVKKNV